MSSEKGSIIKNKVASHLWKKKKDFENQELHEYNVENADETHFMINVGNGITFGFRGDQGVKYVDVVSGGEDMTVMVWISGERNARIEPGLMVFQSKSISYPIWNVPDDISGVSHCSDPKGMDR